MTPRMKLFSNRMDRTENNKENSTEIQIKCFANQKKNKNLSFPVSKFSD